MTTETKNKNTVRPPIVVVMGHIDHGKTKILDWYRKTKVVEQESGGITQHIGAYQINVDNPPSPKATEGQRKITFIDTPGHEAFSKLRSRGAKVADIAILVVAADEGVKPQTQEAISIIRENNLPFIVAINKTDKPEANTERVKQQLAEIEVLVESYGGKVPSVEISAKEGKNMDSLLEMILLIAELENFQANYEKGAEGVVIEAHLDSKRGITATMLIRDGKIIKSDTLVIGKFVESIKILEDFLGKAMEEAGPSSPVLVVGLSATPSAGETFSVFKNKSEAEEFVKSLPEEAIPEKLVVSGATEEGKIIFNLIIKADVAGSLEAIEGLFKRLESDQLKIKILKSEVGDIGESDVKLALATKLVTIVGFKVKTDPAARELAEKNKVRMINGEVIYELLDETKKKMEEMIPPEIKRVDFGRAKVLKIFSASGGSASRRERGSPEEAGGKKEGAKQIIGGRIEEGVIKKNSKFEIKRMKEVIGQGAVLELQHNKQPVSEVEKGSEFGVMVNSKTMIEEGDVLEVYEEEVIKRTL